MRKSKEEWELLLLDGDKRGGHRRFKVTLNRNYLDSVGWIQSTKKIKSTSFISYTEARNKIDEEIKEGQHYWDEVEADESWCPSCRKLIRQRKEDNGKNISSISQDRS